MNRKIIKRILMSVALIISFTTFVGCVDNTATEPAQSGAYFATDTDLISAIIIDNNLSLFYGEQCYLFQFEKSGNAYIGENFRAKVSIKFIEDKLSIVLSGVNNNSVPNESFQLKLNSDIVLSDNIETKLEAPQNIDYSPNDFDGSYSNISWSFETESKSSLFLRQNGILGASIEIKNPHSEVFTTEKILDYTPEPYCIFGIVLNDLNLMPGVNVLRIKHLGGAFLHSDNKIYLSKDSDSVYFNITVDSNNNITAIEIDD